MWVTCEFWGPQGQYTKVRGFVCYDESYIDGCALIAVDPHKVAADTDPPGRCHDGPRR